MFNSLIIAAIILPMVLGAVFPFLKCLKNRKAKMTYVIASLVVSAVFAVTAILLGRANIGEFKLGSLADNLPLLMGIDGITVFFVLFISVVWTLVGIYAVGYMKHEEEEERFFAFFIIVYGVLIGLCCSANLISMYVFYELMTITSLPLVLHTRTKESVMAGLKYLFYSVAGAFLGLFAIFFLYANGADMSFATGSLPAGIDENWLRVAVFLAIIGFGGKAGMFPLHSWLPTAHPVAPSPASGALSGVITKCGVLCVIRIVYSYVGTELIKGTWVQYAWMSLALFTVFMGSMLAYKEPLLKKRLAYSSVSQVSYIMFGLSTLNPYGLTGALFHVVYHSFIKNILFLSAGSYIEQTGLKRVDELRGIGKKMPITTWCFTIASLGLVGIPPLSGFISKWYLALGAIGMDSFTMMPFDISFFGWFGPMILLISALLTAGYLLPVTINGFLPGKDYPQVEKCEAPKIMVFATVALTAIMVLLSLPWAFELMTGVFI